MNTIGGDQQRALVAGGRSAAGLVDEIGAYAVRGLRPSGEMMAGQDVVLAEPVDRGVQKYLMQCAAMDRKLRPLVAGLDSSRFAPDRLAALGKIRQLLGAHAERIKLVVQTKFDQFPHRMRQHI